MHGAVGMSGPLRVLVTVLSALYLVSMMFALGLEAGGVPKETKTQKREKWHLLARGLGVSLLVLPLLAFGIVRALHTSSVVAAALLLLVACPGGRFSPQLVKLGGGDVPLAIELALFVAKFTGFTAVPTAKWMLTLKTLDIRDLTFLAQLVALQLVPMTLGKWMRRKHPAVGNRWLRPAHALAIVTAAVTLVAVLLKADEGVLPLLESRGWIAVAAVGLVSPLVCRLAAGRRPGVGRTFVIGANARDLALALMMASVAFPQKAIHTALFGIWSIYALASFLVALGMWMLGPRAGGRRPGSTLVRQLLSPG